MRVYPGEARQGQWINQRARAALIKSLSSLERKIDIAPQRYHRLARSVYNTVGTWDVKAFKYPPNPLKPIIVDPGDIRFITGRDWKAWQNRRLLLGSVKSGDWDIREPANVPAEQQPYPRVFEEYGIHTAFREHFVNGVAWADTDRYRQRIETTKQQGSEKLNRLHQTLNGFDALYQNIKDKGYKSQLEIGGKSYFHCLLNEIVVDIGRDGEILFVDGRHRLSIAKLLGIKKIPVTVLVRHQQWMECRDTMIAAGETRDHPDLRD